MKPSSFSAMMSPPVASSVLSKSYVFDPRPNLPFRITAKRYWTDSVTGAKKPELDVDGTQDDALTLIFAHAAGFHKEIWEPIIHRLFEQQRGSAGHAHRIQEMWSIDAPNHGDAAVLNEDVLAFGYQLLFSWEDYARGIHAFLVGLGSGVDVDFSKSKLVLLGQSMGAAALLICTTCFPHIKFYSIHMIEPAILGNYDLSEFALYLTRGAENRIDVWRSAKDAYESLKSKSPWRKWDDLTLRIYVENGVRLLPTAEYPDRSDGVTLKCTRMQEAAIYRDIRSSSSAYRLLSHVLKNIPTHIMYGQKADLLRPEWRDDVLNNASGGREKFASVTLIPGAGHLVVQTHPRAVADAIWKSLLQTHLSGRICDIIATRL